MEGDIHGNGSQEAKQTNKQKTQKNKKTKNNPRVTILISDKVDVKTKTIAREKRHYIMMKGSVQQEIITVVDIYEPNTDTPKYTQQILADIKGETDSNTIIVGDFNIPLTMMDKHSDRKLLRGSPGWLNTLSVCFQLRS